MRRSVKKFADRLFVKKMTNISSFFYYVSVILPFRSSERKKEKVFFEKILTNEKQYDIILQRGLRFQPRKHHMAE